jgi:beta-glucosidase
MFGMGKVKQPNVDFTEYKEGIWVGYRYFATAGKNVSYPFGYGLGYTTFDYSKPVVKVGKDGTVTASITVTNNGTAAGKEAVQLYVTAPDGGLVKPAFELRAFAKTGELAPGAYETLTMTIDPYTLASFNEETSAWETAAGAYTAHFAASAEDIRASVPFKLTKAQAWPAHRVMIPKEPVVEVTVK